MAILVMIALSVIAGFWLGAGGPRLTMVNEGLRVAYPGSRAVGAFLAAVALAGLGVLVAKPWVRVAAGVLAAFCLFRGVERLTYSLDTTSSGIVARAHLVRQEIPWREVKDVGIDLTEIRVAGARESTIRIDTSDLTAEQMAALNRTIARRVSESSALASAR
jgi:hypothetical protein